MNLDKIIEEYLEKDENFGFEFNGVDNNVLTKLKEIENLIMPLLIKLQTTQGDLIQWPYEKRKKEITEQIEKILKITRS